MATGRPKVNPDARYHETGKPWLATPGFLGGHNWHPMAFSPQTGLVYIPAQEIGAPYIPEANFKMKRQSANLGVDMDKATMPADRAVVNAVKSGLKGRIIAWDPVARKARWTVELGAPWNGGMLATAGGLLFQGTAAGELVAYDAATGKKLWSFPAQSGIVAPPMTYSIGGKQYLSVVVGWGGVYPLLLGELAKKSNDRPNRSRVLTFSLDGKAVLPEQSAQNFVPPTPPKSFGTPAQLAQGRIAYARTCSGCHGDGVRSGGVLPELRHSGALSDAKVWHSIVYDGVLADNGMVGFNRDLTPADSEAIRAYVTFRANQPD